MPSFLRFVLTPRKVILTIVAIIIAVVMIRLGFWQLDRLQQRKGSNALVIAQVNASPLNLNLDSSDQNLTAMQYRAALVNGTYDFSQQVFLTNQVWKDQMGVHLLTPLLISGTNAAILVDRGWIPLADANPDTARKYDETGLLSIKGIIKLPQNEPVFGISDPALTPGQTRLQTWIVVNLARIKQQTNVSLLPVYIQISPPTDNIKLPYRFASSPDLSEGPHLSYAIQWFSFATILLVGYPYILYRQFQSKQSNS